MLGVYLGAFLGPFGGNVVQVLLPVLQRWYGVEVELAALSETASMVPFAAAQLVSGAMANRFGRRRLLVAGFAAFGLASLWRGSADVRWVARRPRRAGAGQRLYHAPAHGHARGPGGARPPRARFGLVRRREHGRALPGAARRRGAGHARLGSPPA